VQIALPVASRRQSGRHYRVTLSDTGDECDCPDFYWRHINRGNDSHRCKHILAARQLLVEGIPTPDEQRRARG
jgi:predicted nucleic acid-binding Zn finger protein